MSRSRRPLKVFLGLSVFAVLALIVSITLAPNRVSDGLVARWLAQKLELPVTVHGFRVRRPTRIECDSILVGAPNPFANSTLLELNGVEFEPGKSLRAATTRVRVESHASGAVSLCALVDAVKEHDTRGIREFTSGLLELDVIDGKTSTRTALRQGTLSVVQDESSRRIDLVGRIETERESHPLALRFERSNATGDVTLAIEAEQLDLFPVGVVARAFDPGLECAGILGAKLEIVYSASDRRLTTSGSARLSEFVLAWPKVGLREAIGERTFSYDGDLDLDPTRGSLRMRALKIDSQALAMTGDGFLSYRNELRCDLDVAGALNLDRAALKYGALIARFTPIRSLRGTVSFHFARGTAEQRTFDIQGEFFTLGLASGRIVDPNEFRIDGAFTPTVGGIDFSAIHFDSMFLELRGTLELEHLIGTLPLTGRCDLSGELRSDKIVEPLLEFYQPVQVQMLGEAQVHLDCEWSTDDVSLTLGVEAPRFGVHYDQTVGKAIAAYDFFGTPFRLDLTARAPRASDRFASELLAEAHVKCGKATIVRDEIEDLELPIRCEQGTVTLGPWRGRYFEGQVEGTTRIRFTDVPQPTAECSFRVQGARLKGMPHRVAAMTTGVFVGEFAPLRIATDCKVDGTFSGTGRGGSLIEMLGTLNGSGELAIGPGTVTGSRLLEALSEEPSEVGAVRSIESIRAPFTTRDGITSAGPVIVALPGRRVVLASNCDSLGAIRVVVDPETYLGSQLFARVRQQFPPDAIHIRGYFDEPLFQLPERAKWSRLDDDELEPALSKFLAESPAR